MPMTLPRQSVVSIINNLHARFDLVGDGLRLPQITSNTERLAFELLVAQRLVQRAKSRLDMATKRAIEAGVIPDLQSNPAPAGTDKVLFEGECVVVRLKVKNSAWRVDTKALRNRLEASGIPATQVAEWYGECARQSRAPHEVTVEFKLRPESSMETQVESIT